MQWKKLAYEGQRNVRVSRRKENLVKNDKEITKT